jgi:hypothetical protein
LSTGLATLTLDSATGQLTVDHAQLGGGGTAAFLAIKDGQRSNVSTLSYSGATGFADMSIAMSTPKTLIKKTQSATYTVTMRNSSQSTTAGLAARLYFGVAQYSKIVSATMPGGYCILGLQAVNCYPSSNVAQPGSSYTATIKVKPKVKGPLTAYARAYTNSRDLTPTNNDATLTITVK